MSNNMLKSIMMKNESSEMILKMQKNIAKFIIQYQNYDLTPKEVEEAQILYEDLLEMKLTPEQVQIIVNSSGYAKANLVAYTMNDTEARGSLLNALCKLVLGCSYPTYGDNVDIDDFISVLKRETSALFLEIESERQGKSGS